MKLSPEEAVKQARAPYARRCPVCNEILFSPADKLSISLYEKCLKDMDGNSPEMDELIKLIKLI